MPPSSLDPILHPTSIAVIGASRQPNTIGWQVLHNLLMGGFKGPVYPVNPKATAIHSIPAYASIGDVPGPIDLGVVVVPKEFVKTVTEECIAAGVRGLVVISAGFKEVGGDGVAREQELAKLVRDANVRMVGPNCMGVINTNADVQMNATFAPQTPPSGKVALVSQSGAMGLSVLDHAESLGIGISSFVSSGNKIDVSGNDLLEYWENDPETGVILMYLESFGNPTRFIELARRITRRKPICIVKSGRTGAGARAAASHTGALAGTELATEAIMAQAGAIRADTVQELFDLAMGFANQPLPKGNRVAIVTNAGGPGIIIADACESHGLMVTKLSPETEARLRDRLPEEASVRNPVDLIASATATSYEYALGCVFDDPNVDAAIAAFVPPLGIQTKDVAAAIVRVKEQHPKKPLMAVLMGKQGLPAGVAELHDAEIPAYVFPESAARALGAMWTQRQRADKKTGSPQTFDANDERVTKILGDTVAARREKLSEPDAMRVLEAYGIPVVGWSFVESADGDALPDLVATDASTLGFPVALKIVSPDVVHKSDVGGVALGLDSADGVREAVNTMLGKVAASGGETPPRVEGIMLQKMATGDATETIVGLTRVPRVGALVMFGMGGIYVEVIRDVVLRLCPILDTDADEMLKGVKLHKLLEGVRGQPARDPDALRDIILRVAQLAERHPRIAEMDINPVLAKPEGAEALDARVQLGGIGVDSRGARSRWETKRRAGTGW